MPTMSLTHAKYETVDYDGSNFSLLDAKLAVHITSEKCLQQQWQAIVIKKRHVSLSLLNNNTRVRDENP